MEKEKPLCLKGCVWRTWGSERVLSALSRRLGAGAVKEAFDSGDRLRCLLSSALPLTRAKIET